MTNGNKIIIGIIIVVLIIAIIFGVSKNKKTDNNEYKNQKVSTDLFNYLNDMGGKENQVNNIIENNIDEENLISEENEVNEVQNSNSNAVVGKEEQESNKENTEADNRETAIKLAKKEWAISVDSYDFQAELQSDGTYIVKVINKTNRNEVTRYTVNVKTGAVVEAE